MIAIIDYGLGNLGSIKNMLQACNAKDIVMATTREDISRADKFILPGVGSFDMGMNLLNNSGMREELDKQVLENKKPILGICLGMQMLGNKSEEGKENGLGYIDFCCHKFSFSESEYRVPHMGWDIVEISKETALTPNPKDFLKYYFVHSYYAECKNEEDILFYCDYGIRFAAGVNRENIFGVQFHPEKSHNYGKWLIGNFVEEL